MKPLFEMQLSVMKSFNLIFLLFFNFILFFHPLVLPARGNNLDFSKSYLMGNINPKENKDFTLVPKTMSTKKIYLRKDVLWAFDQMHRQALKDGIQLKIISGFRSFHDQKNIWNRKYKYYKTIYPNEKETIKAILRYSAFPGISRHHWGTDIDINSLNNKYFNRHPYGKKVKKWLAKNANDFGFYLVYTPNPIRTGYHYEYWHYTYYPLASKMLHQYLLKIHPNDLKGFHLNYLGMEKIFKDYALGIDQLILKKMKLDGLLIEFN